MTQQGDLDNLELLIAPELQLPEGVLVSQDTSEGRPPPLLPSKPAFIDTDFTVPLEHNSGMDLSVKKTATTSNTMAYLPTTGQTSVGFFQTTANPQVSGAGNQLVFTQGQMTSQGGLLSPKIVSAPSGMISGPTVINVNPSSLGGATLISSPFQVLGQVGGAYPQIVSTVQGARFVSQSATGLGSTVLMPIQQTGLLQQGSIQRAQIINNSHGFGKNIQPKPPNLANIQTGQLKLVSSISTIPSTVVSMASPNTLTFPINIQSSQSGQPQQIQTPTFTPISPLGKMPLPPKTDTALPTGLTAQTLKPIQLPSGQIVFQTSPIKDLIPFSGATIIQATNVNTLLGGATSLAVTPASLACAATTSLFTRPIPTTIQFTNNSLQPFVTCASTVSEIKSEIKSAENPKTVKAEPENGIDLSNSATSSTMSVSNNVIAESSPIKSAPVGQETPINKTVVLKLDPGSSGTKVEINEDKIPVEYEETEFVWEEYLEETSAQAAPPTTFFHVEASLKNSFRKGMKVEVPNKTDEDAYWVASIVMTCGQLLRLRYDGYNDDSSADFWCDIASGDIHPIGWSARKNKNLRPPQAIKDKHEDWTNFLMKTLQGSHSAPAYLLDASTGVTPVDQIKTGMKVEILNLLEPQNVWPATIIENVGGRLLLRHEGSLSVSSDFWLFYLHNRVHPIGWGKTEGLHYKPPSEIADQHPAEKWDYILQKTLEEGEKASVPSALFAEQLDVEEHDFKVGWKLEALHPSQASRFCPATIEKIINKRFFMVAFDNMTSGEKKVMCCHNRTPFIFPMGWCETKGIKLSPPHGYKTSDFKWNDYLASQNAAAAPEECFIVPMVEHEFQRGMKLEAVNPSQPNQICVATITRIVDHLLWLHLDGAPGIVPNQVVEAESFDVFPVGWCESNGYPLKTPRKTGYRRKVAVVQPDCRPNAMSADEVRSATYSQIKAGEGGSSSWCPKIYFNHRCFSGPFLSKGRIAELPKCVGPGPVSLVMKEVLSMLINVAYKSSRVLRELQLEGETNPKLHQLTLKAKYKGKSYRATVEVCKSSGQIEEFCRSICIKLECCPNLFSPLYVSARCPENCSQLTKTKYTYYYGKKKKRKIGRPPGGHTNLENGPKKPGKRRGRKKGLGFKASDKTSPNDSDDTVNSEPSNEQEDDQSSVSSVRTDRLDDDVNEFGDGDFARPQRKKRKWTHQIPPPSIIMTRGARQPKFTFERRTHKKIPVATSPDALSNTQVESNQSKSSGSPSKRESLQLDSNPLTWSVNKVIEFLSTTDCAHLAWMFMDQEIDGQALLLLTLPTLQEYLDLKLGPAIKLCHHIERVKLAFFEQYAN